jgi:hypothetical protein
VVSGGGDSSLANNSMTDVTSVLQVPTTRRVHSGGPAYTDSSGAAWAADFGSSGGGTFAVAAAISNTTDPALYQTVRFGMANYTFPVSNGNYVVTLKFAEILYTAAGKRIFSVAINGNTVLNNFDIVAAAGAGLKAVDKSFSVSVTGGQIVIQFISGADNPSINAIQILPQ